MCYYSENTRAHNRMEVQSPLCTVLGADFSTLLTASPQVWCVLLWGKQRKGGQGLKVQRGSCWGSCELLRGGKGEDCTGLGRRGGPQEPQNLQQTSCLKLYSHEHGPPLFQPSKHILCHFTCSSQQDNFKYSHFTDGKTMAQEVKPPCPIQFKSRPHSPLSSSCPVRENCGSR